MSLQFDDSGRSDGVGDRPASLEWRFLSEECRSPRPNPELVLVEGLAADLCSRREEICHYVQALRLGARIDVSVTWRFVRYSYRAVWKFELRFKLFKTFPTLKSTYIPLGNNYKAFEIGNWVS